MKTKQNTRPIRSFTVLCAGLILSGLLSSCASNEEFEDRLDRRNESYQSFQDRREIRADARQERTDAWFDRVMH